MWDFNVQLLIISHGAGCHDTCGRISGLDASEPREPTEKAELLKSGEIKRGEQAKQLGNPDSRILLKEIEQENLLSFHAKSRTGTRTADNPLFLLHFWELAGLHEYWEFEQTSPTRTEFFSGRHFIVRWESGKGLLKEYARLGIASIQGQDAWEKRGICVGLMRDLPVTLYRGQIFDMNSGVIWCEGSSKLTPIWCYLSSAIYSETIRIIDQQLKLTTATLLKVPFDFDHWQKVAQEKYPNGLPKPYSNDPTQWIFHGHPCGSVIWDEEKKWTAHGPLRVDETVLQVAMARLLGYRWPAELDPEMELADEQREWVKKCEELLEFADEDGIVCIPPVLGEQPAADRLLRLLMRAYGEAWRPEVLDRLLAAVGYAGKTFSSNTASSSTIVPSSGTSGTAGGATASQLSSTTTNSTESSWSASPTRCSETGSPSNAGASRPASEAEDRLAAALELQKKLERILEGEPPYDIFVRWKPLHEQPIGWEPDLNDGVRVNIRPFVEAGVLRKKPNIKWGVDRGKDPESLRPQEQFPWFWEDGKFTGKRVNDVHLTNAEKRAARG